MRVAKIPPPPVNKPIRFQISAKSPGTGTEVDLIRGDYCMSPEIKMLVSVKMSISSFSASITNNLYAFAEVSACSCNAFNHSVQMSGAFYALNLRFLPLCNASI